jgi:UDP-N-acetylglucosamine:LPS N-acetylglucosamine transferase
VGGAGAQKEIAKQILESLKHKIKEHKIRVNLIAGTRLEVGKYFENIVKETGLENEKKYVNILSALDKRSYFEKFNLLLRETDILWTKPSELSFYTALGIPIITSPNLGSHEELNQKWLMQVGSAIPQENPKYTDEWLFELLDNGVLAEAAWEGYMEAPKYGTYNIKALIFSKDKGKIKLKY